MTINFRNDEQTSLLRKTGVGGSLCMSTCPKAANAVQAEVMVFTVSTQSQYCCTVHGTCLQSQVKGYS